LLAEGGWGGWRGWWFIGVSRRGGTDGGGNWLLWLAWPVVGLVGVGVSGEGRLTVCEAWGVS